MKKALKRVSILLTIAICGAACFHHRDNIDSRSSGEIKRGIHLKIVDSATGTPIPGSFVFLVNSQKKISSLSDSVTCQGPFRVKDDGLFNFGTEEDYGHFTIWALAPGYKSIPLYFDRLWKPLGNGYFQHTSGNDIVDATAVLLASIIGKTEIRTDLKDGITTIPLQSIRNDLALWESELTIGLYPLKTECSRLEVTEFIARESAEIAELKKNR
jgi:hypothetical protein